MEIKSLIELQSFHKRYHSIIQKVTFEEEILRERYISPEQTQENLV